MGTFSAFVLIQGLPEMIESIIQEFPKNKRRDVNYKSSGLFTAALGAGQLIAPLYASNIKMLMNFKYACDIVALITLGFGLLYLVVGDGFSAFYLTWQNLWTPDLSKEKERLTE
jgi:hypothetical protein